MITGIIPKLPFINKQLTLEFYNTLGYTMNADYNDYVILHSEHTELHFFSFPTLKPDKSDFMIYLRVQDIDTLYKTLQQKNISIHPNGTLEVKPWRQKEFSITDPNGTLLTFGQAVE
jgi:hypothetical protein